MSSTDVSLANRALAIVGEALLSSTLSENEKVNAIYSSERDTVLAMFKWNFAVKRSRVTAAGILDCSERTIAIVESDPATITDNYSAFVTSNAEAGDIVSIEGSGNNNTEYGIASVVAGTLTLESYEAVTAESLVNDSDLKLYFLTSDGRYKYAQPSDCLRILNVNETNPSNNPTKWTKEGKYIVTTDIDENDQLPIEYIKQVTDPTMFSILFEECFVLKLCSAFALAIKENAEQAKMWNKHFDYRMKQIMQVEGFESNPKKEKELTDWQNAGR